VLKYLTQWYDVHLGCLVDDPADVPHIETVRGMVRQAYVAKLNRRMARLWCLRGLLTGESLSVTFFRDAGLARWVREVVETVRPQVVFVSSGNMAPYVLDLPRTPVRVVDLVDVDSEKWRAYAENTAGPMRLVYRREWRKVAALEQRIARESDLSSLVSDAEAALFRRLNPGSADRIRGIGISVDHRYFDPSLPLPAVFDAAGPVYVFTGTMDYPPNIDAVVWFANDVLPLIRRVLPAARFCIVGANPGPEVQKLARLDGVSVTGRVPDVRPYLAHATAAVAPMRIARGIQNKVLEAMAMAKPVVLTADALEGISAEPGREVILAETTEDFAAACCRLAATADGDAIGAAARRRILRDYDESTALSRFDDLLRPASTGGSVAIQ
jgi:polysaccharide biosynthesis protein PslH